MEISNIFAIEKTSDYSVSNGIFVMHESADPDIISPSMLFWTLFVNVPIYIGTQLDNHIFIDGVDRN